MTPAVATIGRAVAHAIGIDMIGKLLRIVRKAQGERVGLPILERHFGISGEAAKPDLRHPLRAIAQVFLKLRKAAALEPYIGKEAWPRLNS
jgi:hypothetical protein